MAYEGMVQIMDKQKRVALVAHDIVCRLWWSGAKRIKTY